MTGQEELVPADVVITRAIVYSDFTYANQLTDEILAALDRDGYVVVKKSAGIHHERETYVTKEDL